MLGLGVRGLAGKNNIWPIFRTGTLSSDDGDKRGETAFFGWGRDSDTTGK